MIQTGPRIITLDIETSPILAYEAKREYHRLYRAKNKERIAAAQKATYAKNQAARIQASADRYAAKKDEIRARERASRSADPEKWADKKYREKYGLTLAEVLALFEAAGDACQCCSRPVARPRTGALKNDVGHVDHCHMTGAVRGILCSTCNLALGLLDDKPEMAVAYLGKTR